MSRNTHDRLNDHFGQDSDANIVVVGNIGVGPVVADGDDLHTALAAIVAAGGGGGFAVDIQSFSAAGGDTWNKPSGALLTEVVLIGGGGGGGAGGRGGSGTGRAGGSGGGCGGMTRRLFRSSDLDASEELRVGSKGNGAPANTSGTTGQTGSDGESSFFGGADHTSSGFATAKVMAGGGTGGPGGRIDGTRLAGGAAGFGNVASNRGIFNGNETDATLSAIARVLQSGGAGFAGTADAYVKGSRLHHAGGGGAGGSLTTGNADLDGGQGGAPLESPGVGGVSFSNMVGGGGTAGVKGSSGGTHNGGVGPTVSRQALFYGGFGGGGGGGSLTGGVNGGTGGAGSSYGGGGGGGGAALTGTTTGGAGGNGADGLVVVISICST